jgi:type VI secretion system ImpM family protein
MAFVPFLFGKAPAHGDFVARGLSESAEQTWDRWATGELDSARTALALRYESAHEAAPPSAFVAGPSALGDGWRAGAVVASVDAAARRFLLIVGYQGLDASEAGFLGRNAVTVAESIARRIILEQLDADEGIDLLREGAPAAEEIEAAVLAGAEPAAAGVWWSLAGVQNPTQGAGPPVGLLNSVLLRTADLLGDAA